MTIFARVTLPLAAVNFLNQASRAVMAVIGPLLAMEFALSASDLGLLAAALFVGYALAQLPVGLALDLFGPRRVQTVLALVCAAGFATCALAPDPTILGIGRFVTGLGIAAGLMAMLKANTLWYPRHRIAAMTGRGVFVGALGGMAVTLPLATLLPVIGWRGGFVILAAASCAVALWIWLSVRDAPEGTPTPPKRGLAAELAAFARVFVHPVFLRFTPAVAFVAVLQFTWQGLWTGPWLRDVAGMGDATRAGVLFIFACGAAAGSLISGNLASLAQARGLSPYLVSWTAMGGQLLVQLLLLLHVTDDVVLLSLIWFAFAFCGASSTAGYAAVGQSFGPELAGRVATAINALMLCAVFILQYAIGAILDLWPRTATGGWDAAGYSWAFGLSLALQAAAILWMMKGARGG
ncbi:MAG: MFS transporter [Acetobacteraceae bacterium]|nr:MFS transporter [Acetobacteraceae bacterium]